MVVQLCGQISNLEPAEAWEQFNKAENLIKQKDPHVVVINPLRLCDPLTEAFKEQGYEPHYRHYMNICLASIPFVKTLVTLPDAHLSKGAQEEMKEAYTWGKYIISLDEYLK